nr:MAG TPA: hypothetical protein [Caudoviricetes sp.]
MGINIITRKIGSPSYHIYVSKLFVIFVSRSV